MYLFNPLFLIGIVFAVLGMIVSFILKSKFAKYSKERLQTNLSGAEVARKMLDDHGLYDVQVIHVQGRLTDHYNPKDKTVNLSESVYSERNAAAAAVAAHECGHAVQHAKAYAPLKLRSAMVPIQNASGMILNIVIFGSIIAGNLLFEAFPVDWILGLLVAVYGAMALFAIVTLPVEFDASKRALAWIRESGTVNSTEFAGAKDALKWAAMTYVVAAIGAIASFLFVLLRFAGRD